ncbi:MAG: GAF domain-containing protein [Spirulinaceae cyanobacterium]
MLSQNHYSSHLNSKTSLERLLHRITGRIRNSLDLNQILSATVAEVSDYLKTDRIKIYRFARDGSGEVVAECLRGARLPSLQGLHFPADDIPETARQLFAKLGARSLVDVEGAKIGMSPVVPNAEKGFTEAEGILYRELDPCHQEYLTAMGVKSSVVIPIKLTEALDPDLGEEAITPASHPPQLWGLLISHHSQTRTVTPAELRMLQWVSDQVAIAISQSQLLQQAERDRQHQATVNHIATLLHSLQTIKLQHALIETVSALGGSGGRLYLQAQNHRDGDLYTCGIGEALTAPHKKYLYLEEHPAWRALMPHTANDCEDCPPISTRNLYQDPRFQPLQMSFENTPIRGVLMLPLYSRSQFLGSLTIFRNEIATETLWAGYFDPDRKQEFPRQSFKMWRQCQQDSASVWEPQDIKLSQALAQQFAAAIYQHRLYQQVRDLNRNLESQVKERTAQLQKSLDFAQVLRQVTEQIRGSLDLTTTLQTIASEALKLLNSDRAFVYRFENNWLGQVVVEEIQEAWPSCGPDAKNPLVFCETDIERYQTGHVRTMTNITLETLDREYRHTLHALQVQASLIVPIGTGHQLWGLLGIHQCRAPRHWQEQEITLMQHLAEQAAVAITQAELYEHSNQVALLATEKAYELERAAEQQKSLFRVIGKIRKSLNVETIFQTAATEVRRLLNTDRVGIFRLDAEANYNSGTFVAEAVKSGYSTVLDKKVRDRCFGEQYAQHYHHGRIQAVADIYQEDISDCHLQILERFEVRANLVIPVMKGDFLWGLLCIHQCREPREWTDSEIEFVKQIAVHLGVALQQSSLLRQTQEQAEDLSHTLHKLQKAQTQLIQNEKMSSLGQLVAGIAHEINNPVNFIYGNLNHLSDYTHDLLDLLQEYKAAYPTPTEEIVDLSEEIDLEFLQEDLPRLLSSLQVGSDRIRQLVLSLRNFSHHDKAECKPVNIHEGLDNTLLILQHRLKKNNAGVPINVIKKYGELPQINCYAGQLNQVFMNIINNAIDALENDSNPSITITTQITQKERHNHHYAIIKISDNGSGMPEKVKNSIFDPFFTTKPIGKGTGLGLAISYQIIVERHGGFLRCDSQPDRGTTFKIEIPVSRPSNP